MSNTIRNDVVMHARQWLGTPYVHQASCIGVGCDCLGLVRGIWRTFYGKEPEKLPNYTADWAEAKGEETLIQGACRHLVRIPKKQAQKGDVLLFRWKKGLPAKHTGIKTSDTHFIHACEGAPVCEVALSAWWQRRIAAVFTFPNIQD